MGPRMVASVDERALEPFRRLKRAGVSALVRALETYLRDAPQRLSAMKRAAEQGDAQAIYLEAHTLKSSSAQLGAHPLAASLREIEGLAKRDPSAVPPLIAGVEAHFAMTERSLRTILERESQHAVR